MIRKISQTDKGLVLRPSFTLQSRTTCLICSWMSCRRRSRRRCLREQGCRGPTEDNSRLRVACHKYRKTSRRCSGRLLPPSLLEHRQLLHGRLVKRGRVKVSRRERLGGTGTKTDWQLRRFHNYLPTSCSPTGTMDNLRPQLLQRLQLGGGTQEVKGFQKRTTTQAYQAGDCLVPHSDPQRLRRGIAPAAIRKVPNRRSQQDCAPVASLLLQRRLQRGRRRLPKESRSQLVYRRVILLGSPRRDRLSLVQLLMVASAYRNPL